MGIESLEELEFIAYYRSGNSAGFCQDSNELSDARAKHDIGHSQRNLARVRTVRR